MSEIQPVGLLVIEDRWNFQGTQAHNIKKKLKFGFFLSNVFKFGLNSELIFNIFNVIVCCIMLFYLLYRYKHCEKSIVLQHFQKLC